MGIYIHIPFCRKACHYCNFHFSTSLKTKSQFQEALLKEIELQKDYLEGAPVNTIYFGGGTPSLMDPTFLKMVLDTIQQYHNIDVNAEVTLEANPDDLSEENLISWKSIGINRLSIGIQSFYEEDLQWMNRAHTASQAITQLKVALKHFENITIDLIYGTPGLTDEKWKQNVQTAIALKVPHLSCYALTVEPGTALHHFVAKEKTADVNQDVQAKQFLLLQEWVEAAGYDCYEISNYALPGKRSQHNSAYWKNKPYLGLGPSAHSYNQTSRQWNIANNALYIQSIEKGQIPFEKEVLTTAQKMNEWIMTSLRTMEGLPIEKIRTTFGIARSAELENNLKPFLQEGLVIQKADHYLLTREGRLRADGIAAACFFDVER